MIFVRKYSLSQSQSPSFHLLFKILKIIVSKSVWKLRFLTWLCLLCLLDLTLASVLQLQREEINNRSVLSQLTLKPMSSSSRNLIFLFYIIHPTSLYYSTNMVTQNSRTQIQQNYRMGWTSLHIFFSAKL